MNKNTGYYWTNGKGVLFRTQVSDDVVDPFFSTEEEAERFLERKADAKTKSQYSGMVLRKADGEKVKEATDVLTSQAGISQFGVGD